MPGGDIPPPPDGFTIRDAKSDAPAPPPGFTLRQTDGTSLTQGGAASLRGLGVMDDPQYAAPNLLNARASLAPDVGDQIKRYSEGMGIPQERFGVINGDIVYYVPEKNAYAKVTPSMGGQTSILDKIKAVLGQGASNLGPTFPAVVGGLTGIAMGPTGMSIPASGAAAAGTDLLRQGLDKSLAGENPVALGAGGYLNAAGQGALAAGGQALGVGANALLSRNPMGLATYDRANALDPAKRATMADVTTEAQARNFPLSVGQASDLSSIKVQERQLGRYPETTDRMAEFIKQQRAETPRAFGQQLDTIAPAAGREDQIAGFRGGADKVVNDALTARSAQAKTAYAAALDGRDPFMSDEAAALMKRPAMADAWRSAQRLAAEEDVKLPELFVKDSAGNLTLNTKVAPDWRSWDYIKRGLDGVIEANTNDLGRVNAVGRAVNNTKNALLDILDRANPDYAAARGMYGSASDTVNMILDGGVGLLRKMGGLDRQAIVDKVFSGTSVLPEEITRMRQAFLLSGKIDDWNAGLRGFMEGRLDNAMKANAGGTGNVPGKLYADLWGDPKQKGALVAAMGDKGVVDGFEGLFKVLQAAGRSLPEGSPTATDIAATANPSVGSGLRTVGKALSVGSWANVGNEVVEGINAMRTPEARRQLADYLLTGQGLKEIQKFRMLPADGQAALEAAGALLTNAGVIGAGLRTPADRAPSTMR